jgi:O-antigen/teichoic acid export membrane protein
MRAGVGRAIAANAALKTAGQVVSWLSTLLVARFLAPRDFGLVAAAAAMLSFAKVLAEGGVATVVVTYRDLSQEAVEELHGLSTLIGLCIGAVAFLCAPLVETLTGVNGTTIVVRVLSITLPLTGLAAVPSGIVMKEMRLARSGAIEFFRTLATTATVLTLAILGKGAWALIFGDLVSWAILTVLFTRAAPTRVRLPRVATLQPLTSFMAKLLASRLLSLISANLDAVLLGRRQGASTLGSYAFAGNLSNTLSDKITTVVFGIAPALFGEASSDRIRLKKHALNVVELLTLVLAPAAVGLAVVADLAIPFLFGPQWQSAIPIVQVLAVAVVFRTAVAPPIRHALVACKRSDAVLWQTTLAAVIAIPAFWLAAGRGAVEVATVWLLLLPLADVPVWLAARKELALTVRDLLRALRVPFECCLVVAATALLVRFTLSANLPVVQLLATIAAGAVAGLSHAALRKRAWIDRIRQRA